MKSKQSGFHEKTLIWRPQRWTISPYLTKKTHIFPLFGVTFLGEIPMATTMAFIWSAQTNKTTPGGSDDVDPAGTSCSWDAPKLQDGFVITAGLAWFIPLIFRGMFEKYWNMMYPHHLEWFGFDLSIHVFVPLVSAKNVGILAVKCGWKISHLVRYFQLEPSICSVLSRISHDFPS